MAGSGVRLEAVEAGTVKLIGTDKDRIVAEISALVNDQRACQRQARAVSAHGDGNSALRAAAAIT